MMSHDPEFWHTLARPLSKDVLEYAAQDVLFLPQVYECMRKHFLLPYYDRKIDPVSG